VWGSPGIPPVCGTQRAGTGSPSRCSARQEAEGFGAWHTLRLLDGLSENATRRGQHLICWAGDSVVPSQLGRERVVVWLLLGPVQHQSSGTEASLAGLPPAAADIGGSFPTFSSLGSAERVNETICEGPPEATAGGNNLLSALFFFSPANCGVDMVPSHERRFCRLGCWAKPGLGSRLQDPGLSPAHPSPAAGTEMALSATTVTLPPWLPSTHTKKPNLQKPLLLANGSRFSPRFHLTSGGKGQPV